RSVLYMPGSNARAMEKAQAADKLKSAFLATMSHELRTPLNSIIGFTGIILRERVGPLNDEQKKQLNMVRSSSQHLLALINDVLDISKIEAGQLQLAYEDVDVRQVIEKVVQTTRPLAENKGIGLDFRIIDGDMGIKADYRRLEQILLNLAGNAIKFTEKGSVNIICESDGPNLNVRVVDTGIGIKEEDMETIFKTFRQIDSGISRKQEGTGLGLSISKRLVKLMGGNIRVTSVFGSGSTFSFSIPKERKTG
ncbi:MAG TPA: ATP-binding protein, partial [Syntrophorhabdaceae bacterium]|nr:ATP-binding protein [Syntrophorhabdaceae bacterium]